MPDPTSDTLERIYMRIAAGAPSGVWSRGDFLDLASPNAVEKALQRLTNRGDIRRPYRGLYDKPSVSKLTGKLVFPPRASFVDAIARRDKLRILVDGMTAANDLGLTTAAPARSTIHADTYPRTIEINAAAGDIQVSAPVVYRLDFKRASAKAAFWAGRPAMRIVQALAWLRDEPSSIEPAINGIIQKLKNSQSRQAISNDLRSNLAAMPAWMYPAAQEIADSLAPDQNEREKTEDADDVH
ncbi:DUF6088 family protein [Rhizobium lemnae]|jgi:hypothetical protein|uniref:DUF6088 family protein n=2 Tax=Rhizobium TaxID=379 RepID=A0ABV8EH30_9HYPH|nr:MULTISPECIES: DUF6088 family protein [Rhizobium]MCJ8509939.1 DUF6088 family protein [Rhizobium lemnae]MDQ0457442.1 hypothetical protein [Rhizobium paknamense]